VYRQYPELHASEDSWDGFRWIDVDNVAESVWAFLRRRRSGEGGTQLIVAFNATPVPRSQYPLGVPDPGRYRKILDSDAAIFGGSGYATTMEVDAERGGWRDFPAHLRVDLPPLSVVIWERVGN